MEDAPRVLRVDKITQLINNSLGDTFEIRKELQVNLLCSLLHYVLTSTFKRWIICCLRRRKFGSRPERVTLPW